MQKYTYTLIPVQILFLTTSLLAAGKTDDAQKHAQEPSSGKAIEEQVQRAVTDRAANPEFSAEQRGHASDAGVGYSGG
ncbi:MAG: hypothetical protein PHO37_08550 [Kiritimatiellae bacterium]|nr:hypothetical protein [Kiritimatiellia bacterium]